MKSIKRSGGALVLTFFACLGMIQVVHAAASSSVEFIVSTELTLRNGISYQTIAGIPRASVATLDLAARGVNSYATAINLTQSNVTIYTVVAAGQPLFSLHKKFLQLTTNLLLKDKTTVNDRLQGDICV